MLKQAIIAASLAAVAFPTVASARDYNREPTRYEQQHRGPVAAPQHRQTSRYYNVNGRRYAAQNGPAWNAPRGYQHRSWSRNQRLPTEYRRTVVRDYGRYHLPPPQRGQQWVRVDNDVVLVSIASGIIGAVIAGAFN